MTAPSDDRTGGDTYYEYRKSRLACGEAYMMCEDCGARLWSFDGDLDQSRKCPYWTQGKCVMPQERK